MKIQFCQNAPINFYWLDENDKKCTLFPQYPSHSTYLNSIENLQLGYDGTYKLQYGILLGMYSITEKRFQ